MSPRPSPTSGVGAGSAALPVSLAGRRALVVGLGESGLALASHLHGAGCAVSVTDTRAAPPGRDALAERLPQVGFAQCALDAVSLDGVELLALSPGISIERGDGAALIARAQSAGVPVTGEIDLFSAALERAGSQARLIGVTGTNGKTTVTALAAHLARSAGLSVRAAGNIGPSLLAAFDEALAQGELPQLWVLELSSFQLAIARRFEPHAAVILNLTEDHLDWHLDMDSYAAAKRRIAGPGTIAFGLRGDAATFAPGAGEQRSFGPDAPEAVGDLGLVHEGGIAWLAQARPAGDATAARRRKAAEPPLVARLMPAEALRIKGRHNHLNALAALGICEVAGVPMAAMLHALRDYPGEPHRCQTLAVIDGVEFIDDSKGTNVGATVAALAGLPADCWLILGGDGKGQDFAPLRQPVASHAAGVVLIGRDAPRIEAALGPLDVPVLHARDLPEAVSLAAARARSGEAVLLSPACASFDMFDDYKHRARVFAQAVAGIAQDRGILMESSC